MKKQIVLVIAVCLLLVGCIEQTDSKGNPILPTPTVTPTVDLTNLKTEELTVGTGEIAKAGDKLKVHYLGTFEDGTKFESSRDTDQPYQFVLGAGTVIRGWDEGIVGMRVGGKRKITIPANLAYGEAGSNKIPPNSTLVFEIELLEIVK